MAFGKRKMGTAGGRARVRMGPPVYAVVGIRHERTVGLARALTHSRVAHGKRSTLGGKAS